MDILKTLAAELGLREEPLLKTIELIDEGNTIPFISRYRKEVTGGMDDTVLRNLYDRLTYLRGLDARREEIKGLIDKQEKLTDDIVAALDAAGTMTELDDIYRPFRPKRRTRASIAKERGLEPLSALMLSFPESYSEEEIEAFISEEVPDRDAALAGAMDIVAEIVSDDAEVRKEMRELTLREGVLESKGDEDEQSVYKNYLDYSEPVKNIAGHRILAVDRGEKEGVLKVSISLEMEKANIIALRYYPAKGAFASQLEEAVKDSITRLIFPSIEREVRNVLTEQAVDGAIKVFAENLGNLLMQPPVKGFTVMGLDPAYRTGCKIAVVDETGKVLDTTVVYPTKPQNKTAQAAEILVKLIKKHGVTAISIGNGTASRESEIFVADMIKDYKLNVSYMVVSEAGASVYSASKLAAEEFPDFDVTQRSAVSIARRLQDPLAELVKIEPKAIGVGQYQHDMPKAQLEIALDGVVESCVNSVGVDLNTASQPLLARVSGINSSVAKNIVVYREENGAFTSRRQLKKVPKLGDKAFEQSAGFLRVRESKELLDNTGVHPESYSGAKKIIELCGGGDNLAMIEGTAVKYGIKKLSEETGLGVPTIKDILEELAKPGRDPRDELPPPLLRTDLLSIEDLKPGMELKGTVRNVIDFGAFVDIGVHVDGLVHISRLSDKFVKHPREVVKVGDVVTVWVMDVDLSRKRISLTMVKDKLDN